MELYNNVGEEEDNGPNCPTVGFITDPVLLLLLVGMSKYANRYCDIYCLNSYKNFLFFFITNVYALSVLTYDSEHIILTHYVKQIALP